MIGDPLTRKEDARLLAGRGRFVDDVVLPGMAHAVFVRSPHAHARIASLDIRDALDSPGTIAILTGAELADDRIGDIPCASIPPNVMGGKWFRTPFPALAHDAVRSVGQEIAIVVADTHAQALDAAELVAIDYDVQPAAPTVAAAIAAGAPAVWADRPDNLCFVHTLGDRAATDAAFARADHVTTVRIYNQRVAGNPLEPRGCVGVFDQTDDRYRLITSTANPHRIRQILAEQVLRVPGHRFM